MIRLLDSTANSESVGDDKEEGVSRMNEERERRLGICGIEKGLAVTVVRAHKRLTVRRVLEVPLRTGVDFCGV